ncbi:MAG: hypothetical protein JXR49_15710 [Acidobacteria bacterium]|nr:hypothetical protein [Acidobacteriota bacterium]
MPISQSERTVFSKTVFPPTNPHFKYNPEIPGYSSSTGYPTENSDDSVPAGGFTPGKILDDRYRVIGLLGCGGMGEVYRADDLKPGQPVALKYLVRRLRPRCTNNIYRHSPLRLLHLPRRQPHFRRSPARRLTTAESEKTNYVTSPENIILSKLEVFRMGNEVSDSRWRDIPGVLQTKTGQLDLE